MRRVLVDDVRGFKDGRAATVLRTSEQAVTYLRTHPGQYIDELWLDHNLAGDDTAQPLVALLVTLAKQGRPLHVTRIWVHNSNIRQGHRIIQELAAVGYPVQRSYAAKMWRDRR